MSVIHGANYGTPTLDLNFAKNKSLIDTVSGRDYVTFTRSSTGTYVDSDGLIKTASANTPRFDHNPVTGECLGLLVEESRQNYLRFSGFENVVTSALNPGFYNYWGLSSTIASFVNDGTKSPDGISTAYKIVPLSGVSSSNDPSAFTGMWQDTGFALTNNSAVRTVYFKPAGYSSLLIRIGNYSTTRSNLIFNADTITVTSGVGGNASNGIIESVGNGWYRASFSSTSGYYLITFSPYTTDNTFDGTRGIYIWGAQMELGSFPTSYIPTTGSTVTRSADVASITGTNFSRWYNQNEGTMFVNARIQFQPSVSGQFPDIYTTGSYPDRLWLLYLLNANNALTVGADTHPQSLQTLSTSPQTFKVAQALSNTSLSWSGSKDGGSVLSGSLSKSITNTSSISLGGTVGAVKHISRLTYYPTRLQNYQLQQLTK
jgi:hypothetical protein